MQLRGLGDTQAEMLAAQDAGLISVDSTAAPVDIAPSAGSTSDWTSGVTSFLTSIAQPAAEVAKNYFAAETAKAVAPYQYAAPRYGTTPIRYNAQGQPISATGYPMIQPSGTFGGTTMMPVLLLGGAALIAFMLFSKG